MFDIATPEGRRRAIRHFNWVDHGILRYHWHNFDQVAPGVYRANHPSPARFRAYAAMGIKTVLTLRGGEDQPQFLLEKEACDALGLRLEVIQMSARKAPERDKLLTLLDAFTSMEKPFLMHCKSGADRTGLAAALYLIVHEGASVAQAAGQLSFRYIHIRKTKTGVLDHFLRLYDARNRQSPIAIVDWIRDEYDPAVLTESFARRQSGLRFWQGWR